jgi:uncharacterized protein YndB with AHSA1/START domain
MIDQIEREMDLPASPSDVWRSITDPDSLSTWLGDEVELDLTPGGDARFRLGEEIRTGWVEEVSPPDGDADASDLGSDGEPVVARLVFWWSRDDEPASRVELLLIPLSDSETRLRVAETRPLEVLDVVGIPLPGGPSYGGASYGPSLVAA